jgi:hypothetical protein
MPTYVSPFTGTVVTPTDVTYYPLSFSSDQTLAWPAAVNGDEVPAARIMDCAASAAGLTITLPPANQGTLGADILFRNVGAFSFTIEDAEGGQSLVVNAGIAKYVYLTDNESVAGEWSNVTFGAGTSYADAATLAGAGLTTVGGKLAVTQNISNVTSTPIITDLSRATTFNWTGGVGTFNLPITSTLSSGWFIAFRNNGTGTLTIQPNSPALINGLSSIETNPGDSGFIMYNQSSLGFTTVGWQSAANVSFTAATYDVDAVVGDELNLVSFAPIIQTYIAQSGTRSTTLEVTFPAITQVYLLVNDTNETGYNITFVNEGSSQTPISLAAGNTLILLSDGLTLFPLTQTTTGLFYASNGSANVPSFSFTNSTSTGMYLVGTNILGLTANGVQIAKFDNSNLLQPVSTINSRLVANLIDGGTF